jgi:hypothetical protein
MTDVLRIGGANPVDLINRDAFAGFKSSEDSINRQVDITPTGCFGASGRSAMLRKAKTLGWTRRYTVYATAATLDFAIGNMEQLRNELIAAEKFNMGVTDTSDGIAPHEGWVVRRLQSMARPTVWTILYGSVSEAQSELLSLPEDGTILVCGMVELFIMRGARGLDGDGYPVQVS